MQLWNDVRFSVRQLQYIVAIADLGGFRKAAAACGVSQPSLSAQVAQVEAALGVQLFERNARGVRVSATGAALVERARQVLVSVQDLQAAAHQKSDPLRGTVRIGVIPTVCPYLLPEVAPALQHSLPDLHIVWSEDKTATLTQQIEEGRLDAAILAQDRRVGALDHISIGHDVFVLAAAPTHRLMKDRTPASARLLNGETVLLLEDGHCFRDQALALCGTTGAHESDLRATGLSTLAQMVGAGAGVTLLPSMAVNVENRRGQLAVRAFKSPAPRRELVLAWRKGAAWRPALKAVAGVLRTAWAASRSAP
jgi:LysR family transcriptional regulator, hydrogen peroxide-inducible genes activator